ncbi:site-specific DNA-methyltransferase [Virgibacillus pantothenticus]|uniref:site-specific DNA-methyltransferase n=1 Tax=Virgibacillus pantothenticus TaxID=1473 RepID=UPI003D27B082
MDKLDGKTFNGVKDNVEKMRELFPDIFTEGKIDMDKFMLTLGEHVEKEKERYEFTWKGKTEAIQLAQKQTTGTLRPCKEDSVNWEATENLYIEGDNLEVLRILQNSYRNKIKMIYIDPPYNTGKDFVYKDDFHDNINNYLEKNNENMKSNAETNGRFHTDWLNMMYPRLKIAKNFLTNDGAIFISIDQAEYTNLRKMCDEVFGEQNYIGEFIWSGGRKNDSKYISVSHEYVLVYVKSIGTLTEKKIIWRERKEGLEEIYEKANELLEKHEGNGTEASKSLKAWFRTLSDDHPSKQHSHYSYVDENGVFYTDNISWPGGGGPVYDVLHPKTNKPVKIPSRGWLFSKERMNEMIEKDLVYFGEDETKVPTFKRYLKDTEYQVPYSVIYQDSRGAMKRLRDLMGGKIFDFPKDENILSKFIEMITDEDDYVLDFFSGSASTAHAVLKVNAKQGSNRKFILVQLPELTDEKSDAYKAGYKTISDIGKERIRRAGQKVLEETPEIENKLDRGFKVFKLDGTNLQVWDEESLDIEKDLMDMIDPVKDGRTQEDVVYEVLLKYGVNLSIPIEKKSIAGKTVYDIGMGYLLICLERDLTLDLIEDIAKLNPARVVFYDEGFKDDTVRTNAQQILKRYKVEDIRVI